MGGWLTIAVCTILTGYMLWVLFSFFSFRSLTSVERIVDPPDTWPVVSVIVPIRNEEDQIEGLIDDLSAQSYPDERKEIIFVDDHSSPSVREVVQSGHADHSSLRIIELDSEVRGKKAALDEGIRQAEGAWIVTTDADTRRATHWLETMISYAIKKNLSALAGPIMIRPIRAWIGHFEALEQSILTALSAVGIASGTMPLCSGANFAFRKSFFEEVGGYSGNERIASGDDVFLMQKFLSRDEERCGFVLNESAVVYTYSHQYLFDYVRQRTRWSGKIRSVGNRLMLVHGALPYIANVTLTIGLIAWLLGGMSAVVLFVLFTCKAVFETLWNQKVLWSLKTRSSSLVGTLILALLYPFFSSGSLILIALNSFRLQEWKGRVIQSWE